MKNRRSWLHHPSTNLGLALILVATSLIEVWHSRTGDPVMIPMGGMDMNAGVHDGVLIYGLVHLLRAMAELAGDVERGLKTPP